MNEALPGATGPVAQPRCPCPDPARPQPREVFAFLSFFVLLFVLSPSPFFSCVNFQVPLIIIVPPPGAPPLPLLPLPMTATSYRGDHIKLQADSFGLHIVPV